ncbi:S8 family serine peptidase [Sorangium sp. So ce726]|uniref:S8 family peptidase n=1 Tax=Sorangium sp. So ce726 TaxID=3133319 RepID=UPI003F5EA825
MTHKYTVLRAIRGINTHGRLAAALPLATRLDALDSGPPELRVEVEALRPTDIADLSRDPSVAGLAMTVPTKLVEPVAAPASVTPSTAWGLAAVGADRSPFDGTGVVVAVLDTGIDATHPAFQGLKLVQKDFSGDGSGDRNGHGTHCAGTIFGRDVGRTRIGVARGVTRALIGKVLRDSGSGDSDWIFDALVWAIQEEAQVISMSLGFDFPGLVVQLREQGMPETAAVSVAIEAYRSNIDMFNSIMDLATARARFSGGTIVVAAAGNESGRNEKRPFEVAAAPPSSARGVMAIGALGRDGDRYVIADFSNTLPTLSAPGIEILSARVGGGLHSLTGTSMAAPHAAGVAAMWWQAVRNTPVPVSASTVSAKLIASARSNVFATGVDVADRGAGLITAPL